MGQRESAEFRLERAKKLERALRNKQWTRTFLATKTGYDERTIRNVLSGTQVKDKTIVDICQALGVEPILDDLRDSVEVADDFYGGYSRTTYHAYETFYAFYRRDILDEKVIYKSIFEIFWDDAERRMGFREYYRLSSTSSSVLKASPVEAHTGAVHISPYTSLMHMVTFLEGSVRLITLTKMLLFEQIMRGVLLTQTEAIASYQPVVCPVVIHALSEYNLELQLKHDIRLLTAEQDEYYFADRELQVAEKQVIKLALGQNALSV
jgi:lambda repressor-like predicted transcriptional regulator